MPSLCRNVKTEYESLKKLNAEFVSACETAGDPRALSADQLRTLQIQKKKLEESRDAIENKIENKTWRETLAITLEQVIDRGDGKDALSVETQINSEWFRNNLYEWIRTQARQAPVSGESALRAYRDFYAASELGLFDEMSTEQMKPLMSLLTMPDAETKFVDYLKSLMSVVEALKNSNDADAIARPTIRFIQGVEASRGVSFSPQAREVIQNLKMSERMRVSLADLLMRDIHGIETEQRQGQRTACVQRLLVGLAAGIDDEVFRREEIQRIRNAAETETVQQEITTTIWLDVKASTGVASSVGYAVSELHALQKLDSLFGRRRKNKI